MVSIVVGGTRAVVARIVVVSRAVGTARGDLVRRAATATAGSGAGAGARGGRVVGGHIDLSFEMDESSCTVILGGGLR